MENEILRDPAVVLVEGTTINETPISGGENEDYEVWECIEDVSIKGDEGDGKDHDLGKTCSNGDFRFGVCVRANKVKLKFDDTKGRYEKKDHDLVVPAGPGPHTIPDLKIKMKR